MRVVLDTNVLISAILFKNRLGIIYDLIQSEKIVPCFTPATILEFKNVIERPKFKKIFAKLGLNPDEVIALVITKSEIFPQIKIPQIIKEDPSDNHFLACALISDAKFIVSGDDHLLKIKKFQSIPIITPKNFIEKYIPA